MTIISSAPILLPFDGSQAAVHAARHVAANAKGAKVHLLNVQDPLILDSAYAAASYAIVRWHRRDGEAILRGAVDILLDGELSVEEEVAFGRPAETIRRVARDRACGLIVLGTRARHPLAELFRTSLACRVARESLVPVLIVPSVRQPVTQGTRYVAPPIGV